MSMSVSDAFTSIAFLKYLHARARANLNVIIKNRTYIFYVQQSFCLNCSKSIGKYIILMI